MRQIGSLVLTALVSIVVPANSIRGGEARSSPVPTEPLFSRHIVPLFSRLGCNGGACHGAVQGKGGLRLSLYGVDPQLDHNRLLREFGGRRLNVLDADASLVLLKATARVPHGGGKRLEVGSAEYQLIRNWIAAGARLDPVEKSAVRRLEVTPASRTAKPGERFTLRVQAVYADGSQEEVTSLCSFEAVNREVVEVDRNGEVLARSVGDTAIVVRYPGQVGWATTIVLPEQPAENFPSIQATNLIDRHVLARLRLLSLQPSPICDDATFLRRVTLDVTGLLPTPQEIRAFLADKDPSKRAKKIDELLERPGYAALWATKFMDILRLSGYSPGGPFPPSVTDEYRAYEWLRARFRENVPYDQLVERILLATSREGRDYDAWANEMAAILNEEAEAKPPATYAARHTLDLFWQRRMATDVDHAIRVGHAFLGLRLQCAQCHRHPHDVWTQEDLLSFANFFMRMPHFNSMAGSRAQPAPEAIAAAKRRAADLPSRLQSSFVKSFEREIFVLTREHLEGPGMKGGRSFFNTSKDGFATVTSPLGTQSSRQMRLLGESTAYPLPNDGSDPRALVMAWLRRPDNPFFTRAIVNRVWAHYFDRGLIDPPDDLSPLNPPSHPELLQELCDGLIANKYDLKWLHRTILNSRTYQQSSLTNASNRHDRRNFASFYVRRLPAEVLLDIIDQATGSSGYDKGDRSVRDPGKMPAGLRMLEGGAIFCRGDGASTFALNTFGRPERNVEVVCDCERDNQATMLQALFLANHPWLRAKIADKQGLVARLAQASLSDDERIEELFLATLSRLPTPIEMKLSQDYLKQTGSTVKGLEGLLWALLNTNEFLFNH
ncbi:hypothetical protein HRbin36_01754 [bacterium HR36]|nr:hypothetical protein HRbin36_01754 [bacterium HR36]